jgi:hypothetical protein
MIFASTANGFQWISQKIMKIKWQTIYQEVKIRSRAVRQTCAEYLLTSPVHMGCSAMICGDMRNAGKCTVHI